ncbi:MAG: hypothetical protein Q7J59_05445 [Elusimicrobiota bacterium]|nr:hypothetical protein [Elusimicrobiota bacterium]
MNPHYFITHCSKEKSSDTALLPALRRYLAPHIEYVYKQAQVSGAGFLIFSGKYGFLEADEPIPYYDTLLSRGDFAIMADKVDAQYKKYAFDKLSFFHLDITKDPKLAVYRDFIESFAVRNGIEAEFQTLDM